jgi:hypothetical protein
MFHLNPLTITGSENFKLFEPIAKIKWERPKLKFENWLITPLKIIHNCLFVRHPMANSKFYHEKKATISKQSRPPLH